MVLGFLKLLFALFKILQSIFCFEEVYFEIPEFAASWLRLYLA